MWAQIASGMNVRKSARIPKKSAWQEITAHVAQRLLRGELTKTAAVSELVRLGSRREAAVDYIQIVCPGERVAEQESHERKD